MTEATERCTLTIIHEPGHVAGAPGAVCGTGGVLLVVAKPAGALDLGIGISVAPAGHALQQQDDRHTKFGHWTA